jgi:hypothetical protein
MRYDSLIGGAEAAIWFERELNQIREEILQFDIPPNNGFRYFPQATDISPWAETYTHRMWEATGSTEFLSDRQYELPEVGTQFYEETFNAREFGCAYAFGVLEIEKSRALGKGLETKNPLAAREMIEHTFNQIMWYGDLEAELFGILNYPQISRIFMPFGIKASVDGPNILAQLNFACNYTFNVSLQASEADTLLLSTHHYSYISTTPWSEKAGDTTILKHLLENHPTIRTIAPARELNGAGPNGEDLGLVFKNDARSFSHKLIRPMSQLAPQQKGLAIVTNVHARSGGMAVDKLRDVAVLVFPH